MRLMSRRSKKLLLRQKSAWVNSKSAPIQVLPLQSRSAASDRHTCRDKVRFRLQAAYGEVKPVTLWGSQKYLPEASGCLKARQLERQKVVQAAGRALPIFGNGLLVL